MIKESLKPSFYQILYEWQNRAQRIRLIRSQVAGFIELSTNNKCKLCPNTWGLRCEMMENIEDLFKGFIKYDKKQSMIHWSITSWQNFFIEHAKFRTTCFQCAEKILDHHRKTSSKKAVICVTMAKCIIPRKKNRKIRKNKDPNMVSLILKKWKFLAQQNLGRINNISQN